MNLDSVVVDASFIINMYQLSLIAKLCEVFDKVLVTPTVWKECQRIWEELEHVHCMSQVVLSSEENEMAEKLHSEFCESYPGFHRGEIEALVLANTRDCPIVISDNFAPWVVQKRHPEFERIRIYRGFYFVESLLDAKLITSDVVKQLQGMYPRKVIRRLEQKSQEEK